MTRTDYIATQLKNLAIDVKVTAQIDNFDDQTDGEIEITGTNLSIQVGSNYLILTEDNGDDSFSFGQARRTFEKLVSDIRRAEKRALIRKGTLV